MKVYKFSRLIVIVIILAAAAAIFTVYSNVAVYRAAGTGVYNQSACPKAEAAIVLGAMVYRNGALSQMLADRMDTGIDLYKGGKVKKLLLTGDHGRTTYDEVNHMRAYALKRGVPEQDIFMDHAGFSTYDSMYRARDIFGVSNAVIVTQDFHLPRALYIARSLGIKACGVNADRRKYPGQEYQFFRELLARTKAVAQLVINSKPKYLGPAIPITGDGRATQDKV